MNEPSNDKKAVCGTEKYLRELRRGAAARLIFAGILFFMAAVLFFACELSGEGRSSGAQEAPSGITEPSEAPPVRERRFSKNCFIEGIDVSGLTEREARERLQPRADELAAGYECTLSFGERRFTVSGAELDVEADLSGVLRTALEQGSGSYALTVRPRSGQKLLAAVDRLSESIDREPRSAALMPLGEAEAQGLAVESSNARFAVTKREDGLQLDRERTVQLIADGERNIELPVSTVPAGGEHIELPERRAVFSTSFLSASLAAANRVANIKKAAALINGAVLESGESLSCNRILGERTDEAGWLAATAFANGGAETQQLPGGGICQVSTTLYNCALLAVLDVPERHGHSRKVSYIGGGRDAALNYGTADLVVRNSTGSRIYIYMWVDESEGKIYCDIYGEPLPDEYDEVSLISELTETIEPGEPEFEADPTLSPGDCVLIRSAITGSTYRTFRVFSKDGQEVRRESVDETTYAMHPALYAVAPGVG